MSSDTQSSPITASPQPPQHLTEFYSFVNPGMPSPALSGVSKNGNEHENGIKNGHVYPSPVTSSTKTPGGGGGGRGIISRHNPEHHSRSGSSVGHHHNPSTSSTGWGGLGNIFRRSSIASLRTADDSTIASNASFANVANNHPDLPALITNSEIVNTCNTYQSLLESAAIYREAISTVSKAAADFGAALEACSRCKGAGSSSDGLQAAGGLHYLVSNHQQILAKSMQGAFEIPVKRSLESFKQVSRENEQTFKNQLREKTRHLKAREAETQRMAHRRIRNLGEYRNSLLELTSLVDDIDRLKYAYFQTAYDVAESTSTEILEYAASVVRAEVEIYEGIARKGWSGGGLEDLISSCPDPFSVEDDDDVKGINDNDNNSNNNNNNGAGTSTLRGNNGYINGGLTAGQIGNSSNATRTHMTQIFSILPTNSILPQRTKDDEIDTLRGHRRLGDDSEDEDNGHNDDSDDDDLGPTDRLRYAGGIIEEQKRLNTNDQQTEIVNVDENEDELDTSDPRQDDSFYTEPVLPSRSQTVSVDHPATPILQTHRSYSDDMIGYSGWNHRSPGNNVTDGDNDSDDVGSFHHHLANSTPIAKSSSEDLDEAIKSPHRHMHEVESATPFTF